jgi:hypothetical protein
VQRSQLIAIYVLVAAVLSVVSILAVLTVQWGIDGSGSVEGVGLGVYWDPECTSVTSSLDFGLLEPGSSKSFSLYVRNEGEAPLGLSMTSENWDPANVEDYLTLTWDLEGQKFGPDEVRACMITISVFEDIQGVDSFSLDIIISGTG